MFHALFIVFAAVAAAFFVYRRQLDPLAAAFGSSIVYFTPGLLGYSHFLYGDGTRQYLEPIVPAAYAAMAIVILSLGLGAVVADRVPRISLPEIGGQKLVPSILLTMALGAAAISVWRTGAYYLCVDKTYVLQNVDVWYSYASLAAPFCVAAAVATRSWVVAVLGTILLLGDLYAGFRTGIAITLLSVAMLFENWAFGGCRRFAIFLAALAAAGFLLFVVKHLIVPIKYYGAAGCPVQTSESKPGRIDQSAAPQTSAENAEQVIQKLTSSTFYLGAFISQSEPSVTQGVLNEVARTGFSTNARYLVEQISAGIPLGESLFGIDSRQTVSFNTLYQKKLFPSATFAMANNPWAQALAAGGLWMVAVFAAGFASILTALNILFRSTFGAVKGGIAVIAAWIGFYFHRNDLLVEIVLLKHVGYLLAGALVVAWVLSLIFRSFRLHNTVRLARGTRTWMVGTGKDDPS